MSKQRVADDLDTASWELHDWMDTYPQPGEFVGQGGTFDIFGDQVEGLNYNHALYTWTKNKVVAGGGEFQKCRICGAHIRYAVLFAEGGHLHNVGEDCAKFVQSKLPRKVWRQMKAEREVKEIETGKGKRYILSVQATPDFWAIPREQRPSWVSARPGKPDRYGNKQWWLTVWGELPGETILHFQELKTLIRLS